MRVVRELTLGESRVALVPYAPNSDAGFGHRAAVVEGRMLSDALVAYEYGRDHPLQSFLRAEVR